ncbi:hypothetical protein [Haloplanus halobius]|uniref:hypothetical protein n=1 Tax=Haloplanus halobius TaxID=2934938 RepID=UPI00200D133D|nr:hypothetical protein [Haloplanus sp. XH21]
MSALRSAARATLNSPRLLALAALAAIAETAIRIGATLAESIPLAILWPPISVVVLGLVAPNVRAALPPAVRPDDVGRPALPVLLAVAVGGHALALAVGTTAFLLLDTPVRVALYWLGYGDALTTLSVQVGGAIIGVAVGTLLGWVVVAPAVGRVVAGESPSRALGAALAGADASPRTVARLLAVHLAFAGLLAVAVATAIRSGRLVGLVLGGAIAVLVSAFALALLAARAIAAAPADASSPDWRRVVLVVVLLVAAGTAVGGVRAAELRPTATHSASLPDDPDTAYATAHENTLRADHRYRVAVLAPDADPFVVEHRIDRTDRQYRQSTAGRAHGPAVYASAGTGSPPTRGLDAVALGSRTVGSDERPVRAAPDYVSWADRYDWAPGGGLQPPVSGVDGWRVVERGDDRLVLELTDSEAVFAATQPNAPDRLSNVSAARIRAVIDRESATLERIDVRFDGTVTSNGDPTRIASRVRHEFTVGVDVKRPLALGTPWPGELVWRVLVY